MLSYISPAIGITLSSLIIYYLNNLKTIGCACALNYKRDYIMGFSGILIAMNLAAVVVGGSHKLAAVYMKYPVLYGFLVALTIGAIVNIVFTLQYVEEMKRINCDCSESVYRDMMFILAIIQAASYGIIAILAAYLGYSAVTAMKMGRR